MKDSDKLTYVVEKIGSIDSTLQFQSKQLEEHIKRTELLEERFIPVEDHVKFIRTLMRAALYLSTLTGAIGATLHYLGKL